MEIPICNGIERIKDENGKKLHSAQKPERLLEYVLLTSTNKGDIVLDPSAGTGTTACVAKKHGRKLVVIEKEERYISYIKKRLGLHD